ncbi:MAG: T9SS type A sorting domain-containing protein [Bacteroidota bacterium]
MRLCSFLLAFAFLAAPATAQITYDGEITEADWYLVDTDDGGPGNGFGDFNTLNAIYADIADDGSSISLAIAGLVDRDDTSFGNRLVVLLDTRAGGYNNGDFGRDGAPDARGISDFNSGSIFDEGFFADYALQIHCSSTDCFFNLYTLSGTAGSGGGPNTFLGTETDPDVGSFLDFANTNTRTRGYEVRLTASSDGVGTDIQLDRQSFQAFAFITTATTGFLSNQFLTPAGSDNNNYGRDPVFFNFAPPDPVVYAEQVFADEKSAAFQDKGYRMLAAPARDLTVQWLADQDVVAFNGTPNGGPPRFVVDGYDTAAGGFIQASTFSDPLPPVRGFLWFLSDGRRGSQALPWVLEAGGPMATGTSVSLEIGNSNSVNSDNFYLVGNPFVDGLLGSSVFGSLPGQNVADAFYVFDPGSNSYIALSRSGGDILAPMQGAFFEISNDLNLSGIIWQIPQSGRTSGGVFQTKSASRARLVLEREGDEGWVRADEVALALGETLATGKPLRAPDGSALPARMTLESATRGDLGQAGVRETGDRFALTLDAAPGRYRLSLDGAVPGLATILRDAVTGETLALDAGMVHTFEGDPSGRFSLDLTPVTEAPEAEVPPAIRRVGEVYPNPASGTAQVLVDAPGESVRVEIRDVLGRLVTVAFEGETVGPQAVAVDARGLAPGAYVVRVIGETFAETRRLTIAR